MDGGHANSQAITVPGCPVGGDPLWPGAGVFGDKEYALLWGSMLSLVLSLVVLWWFLVAETKIIDGTS